MQKRLSLIFVVIILLVATGSIAHGEELTTSQIAEKALTATVVVQIPGVGLGSGALVSDDGTVLTCYHVVDKAKSALVKSSNGGYFPAKGLLGFNPSLDIAVVKIDCKSLPYLSIGDSSTLKPGDKVVAIGSPRGLENTVSEGIISALRRIGDMPDEMKKEMIDSGRNENDMLIQFTAPISPGNSGGPLLNSAGEIVGIVILKYLAGDNIYFAAPVNEAKNLLANKTVMGFEEIDFSSIGGIKKRIGQGSKELGLGSVTEKKIEARIPKSGEPTLSVLPGLSPDVASFSVFDAAAKKQYLECSGTPSQSEYKVLNGGSLLFSSADAGRTMSISFKARPMTVAILPIVDTSNLPYMSGAMRDCLTSTLTNYGFNMLSEAETSAVVRSAQVNVDAVIYGIGDALSVENITKLADELNATYLVFGAVGASSTDAGYYQSAGAAATVLMFDGRTGKMILTKQQGVEKNTSFSLSGKKSVRIGIIRGMIDKMFREYFAIKD